MKIIQNLHGREYHKALNEKGLQIYVRMARSSTLGGPEAKC